MSGFTLTNGATVNGQAGGGVWCQSTNCLVTNCVIVGNSANPFGGGAYRGTLVNCTLTGNRAGSGGGGVAGGLLRNCRIFGNSAGSSGGGAFGDDATSISCTLYGCVLIGNTAPNGGGAYGSSGGNPQCTLNNCTVTGNSATSSGGGAYLCNLNNTIIYFNTAPSNANCSPSSPRNYCCTTPLPGFGVGNISADPLLASASHLSSASPCRGAGSAAYISGGDIDGEAWASPPSIGCDEFQSGAATGPLSVVISAALTTVMTNYPVGLNAVIEGRMTASSWDFGDGLVSSNQPITTHVWSTLGTFPVVLRGYNDSNPGGVSATVTVQVVSRPIHYVSAISINPIPPYTTWATAATSIQDAVDAATVPGALVLVTNGIYASGGRALAGTMTNRVAVDKLLELRSVNGPQLTAIQGYQVPGTTNGNGAIRCVYLTNSASLSGFTLTNGATVSNENGGGVRCQSATAVVSNCVVVSNSSASSGGGASGGTLINCSLNGNSAYEGGGAVGVALTNCTLSGNSAAYRGGAVYGSTLTNSALSGNSASEGGGAYGGTLNNCTLSTNSAVNYGGGVAGFCTLTNCILNSNSVFENQFGGGGGAHQSTLDHCTLTGNSAAYEGGGASGASTLRNCVVIGNAAPFGGGAYSGIISSCTIISNSAGSGGGVYSATLQNCVLSGNSASSNGGGASGGTLVNCTIIGNSAYEAGGTSYCTLSNSIVYFNTSDQGANYDDFSTLTYCCTMPAPTNGIGNITNEPLFADQAGGNFRLQSNSPCINSGDNASVVGNSDLDGRPRTVGGTVDIGAYEFQPGVNGLFLGWLQQYKLPTDGSADHADADGDRLSNWQEWIAGTIPTNALSALRLLNPSKGVSGITVSWQSIANRNYFLERSTNLNADPAFLTLATNILGQVDTTSYTDTNGVVLGTYFYRIGVRQ